MSSSQCLKTMLVFLFIIWFLFMCMLILRSKLDMHNIKYNTMSVANMDHISDISNMGCNVFSAKEFDPGAGFGTIIYMHTINSAIYAEQHNLSLFVDYNALQSHTPNNKYYDPLFGSNIWNYFFEYTLPKKCNLSISNITELDPLSQIHTHFKPDYAVRAWYYGHSGTTDFEFKLHSPNTYHEHWFAEKRKKGNKIVSKYFRIKSELKREIMEFINSKFVGYQVLGVHMRGTDKMILSHHRRNVEWTEYIPYIRCYLKYFETNGKVFIATDDANYLKNILNEFVEQYKNHTIIVQSRNVIRSNSSTAVFNLKNVSKYNIGKDILFDIQLLSHCQWFVHSGSSVAEAAFYHNFLLHNHSIHLEYTQNRQIPFWKHTCE
eukprot:337330_1